MVTDGHLDPKFKTLKINNLNRLIFKHRPCQLSSYDKKIDSFFPCAGMGVWYLGHVQM
jgi:hypothetical protein